MGPVSIMPSLKAFSPLIQTPVLHLVAIWHFVIQSATQDQAIELTMSSA